jgi:putative sterol carrier protein
MPGFANEDELYRYTGGIFLKAFEDPELGPKVKESGLKFAVKCTEPDCALTVDLVNHTVEKGADDSADAALLMTTETSNAYWQGKVNLPFAMARGKVKVEGNVAKLLALSPLSKKLIPLYVDMLKADGRDDLIVS